MDQLLARIADAASDLESLARNLASSPVNYHTEHDLAAIVEDAERLLSAHFDTAAALADD